MRVLAITLFVGLSISCFGQGVPTIHTPNDYSGYSPKRTLTILLKNDTTIKIRTRINVLSKPQSITVKMGREDKEILPKDTHEVSWVTLDDRTISGIPADSCWWFKAIDGEISSFSNIPAEGWVYAIAIRNGDSGPILPLTAENLKSMTADIKDPEFNKLLAKNKASAALKRYYKIANKAP